jgi:CheY-like chemotaxis protein
MIPVLIAEDDADTRETFKLVLEDAGYAVLEAANGQEAFDVLRCYPQPLIVMMDISLPRLDGLSILRMMTRSEVTSQQRAYILCTGYSPYLYAPFASLLSELHVPVLYKPFDVDDLLTAVRHAEISLTLSDPLPLPCPDEPPREVLGA